MYACTCLRMYVCMYICVCCMQACLYVTLKDNRTFLSYIQVKCVFVVCVDVCVYGGVYVSMFVYVSMEDRHAIHSYTHVNFMFVLLCVHECMYKLTAPTGYDSLLSAYSHMWLCIVCIQVCVCVCIYIYIYIYDLLLKAYSIPTCGSALYVSMVVCVYIYIHTHIHINT